MTYRLARNYAGPIWEPDLASQPKAMRVIYFSLDYTPHDYRFLSALAETEHEVFFVRLQRGQRQVEDRPIPTRITQILWAGGQAPFKWLNLPGLVLDFKRVLQEVKPDLVHAGPIQTCAFITVLAGFHPILTMSWGFDLMKDVERGGWWRFATRYTLKHSTYFTSDANITCDKAVSYGMDPSRTVVFPWGVDLEHFYPSPRDIPLGGSDSFTLFCNRSWESNYGVDVLARAFVRVAQKRDDVSLLLLGGGSLGPQIRKILADGGVLERVSFPGQITQKELPRFYRMADIYISPSHVDGSSVSLMEALACGLPCLVSDIPANLEWVRENGNGWLFPDSDDSLLAEKILSAIEQRTELSTIGREARSTAEEKADWPKNVRTLLAAYEETVRYA